MTPNAQVRVRFAPSPTGYLHVGGARTALFNWLFARASSGTFVLRIEDTDRQRSSDEMTDAILDGLSWLGLDWDEGPLHQADGLERHRADALRLIGTGGAYRCFCTTTELEARREAHPDGPAAFRYDRRCLALADAAAHARAAAGEPHAVRFRVPEGRTSWDDAVHGAISFENADIEDFVILRTDGTPIYNMAVVSDDVAMRITHVIRGDDHISNTPKQLLLYHALGAPAPVFAHVPMILGPDGRRLSKRHGATAIGEYRQQGILSDAMVNFLALLGWNPGTEEEIFSREQLTERFSLASINTKSAVFDTQKLEWMNGRYLASLDAEQLLGAVRAVYPEATQYGDDWLVRLIELLKVRARTITEMVAQAAAYITEDVEYHADAVARHWKDPAAAARLDELARRLSALPEWTEATLEAVLRTTAEDMGIGAGKLIHPLRVALTGSAASPGIFEVAALLGQRRTLDRLQRAVEKLRHRSGTS
jgi:glutamyl-tRNA synthetase